MTQSADYRRLLDNVPDVVLRLRLSPTFAVDYLNSAFTSITSVAADEIILDPRRLLRMIHRDDLRGLAAMLRLATEKPLRVVLRVFRPDGGMVWMEARLILDQREHETILEGVASDITGRKLADDRQQAVYRISEAAITTKNLQDLYREVHRIVNELVPANNFFIALYHSQEEMMEFPYYIDENVPPPSPRKRGNGITEYLIRHGKPLLLNSEEIYNLVALGEVGEARRGAAIPVDWIGVPLRRASGEVFGAIVTQTYHHDIRFDRSQLDLLAFVSNQIAMAIERKKSEEALKEINEKLSLMVAERTAALEVELVERAYRERIQAALFRISEAAATAEDLQDLFRQMHQTIDSLIDAKNLYIAFYDKATDTLLFPYYVDEYDDPPGAEEMETEGYRRGLTMYVVRTGRPELVSPERFQELVAMGEISPLGTPPLDWIGVPLRASADRVIGVLVVQTYTTASRYTWRDLELVNFVSRQVATAIERQRTSEALRSSEGRYRALIEDQSELVCRWLPDGKLTFANEAFIRYFNRSREALMRLRFIDLFDETDRFEYEATLNQLGVDQHQVMLESRIITANDEIQWQQWTNSAVLGNSSGERQSVGRDITERKHAEAQLEEANTRLQNWVAQLEQRNREITLLNEMGELLQSCLSLEEAYQVVGKYGPMLFQGQPGGLYMLNPNLSQVEAVAQWGEALPDVDSFSPNDCWGLRRGRVHIVLNPRNSLRCSHTSPNEAYLCAPLIAQGESLGLLHQHISSTETSQRWEQLAITIAEHIGMSIANLRLRETLRYQSIRDPLTGLFNRRYMEETLERELRRANRYHRPVGVLILDIDHFKMYNDQFGHPAGDLMLQEVGEFLRRSVRSGDVACRYGGEEFLLILPEADIHDTEMRAWELCENVRKVSINHHLENSGHITLSIGVATYPENANAPKDLLRAADDALFKAKTQGRDRVVIAPVSS